MYSGFKQFVGLAFAASVFTSSPVHAAESPPLEAQEHTDAERTRPAMELPGLSYSLSVDVSLCSKYLFQGIEYSGGPVAQPEAVVGYKSFTVTSWFNFEPSISQWNEIDVTFKYSHEIQEHTIAGGYNYLTYPNRDWDPTQELLLELGLDVPLSPVFSVHYDFGAGDGSYTQIGLTHPVTSFLSLGTNVFYQSHYYSMTGIPSVEIKASSSVGFGALIVTPALSYFHSRDNGDFRDDLRPRRSWLLAVNLAQQVR